MNPGRKQLCPLCNTEFELTSPTQKYCLDCKEFRGAEIRTIQKKERAERARRLAKIRNRKTINQLVADLEDYNERHGTRLSYGQYVAKLEHGWLED